MSSRGSVAQDLSASIRDGYSQILLVAWPLGTCIPLMGKPRITLFDVLCLFILLSKPKRAYSNTLVAPVFLGLVVLYNAIYLVSALATHASLAQTIWRLGAFDLLVIDVLAVAAVLNAATLAQANAFFLYYSVGLCLQIVFPEQVQVDTSPIKFLLNVPLAVVMLAGAYLLPVSWGLRRLISGALLVVYSAVSALSGARMAAAIQIIPVLFYFLPALKVFRNVNVKTYTASVAGAVAGACGLIIGYYQLAVAGLFGQTAKNIALFQSHFFGGGLGLLLGGRPEFIFLVLGTIASPWLGHGVGNGTLAFEQMMVEAEMWNPDYLGTGKTIIHSLIFGASFEAGVLTMLFWLYVLHLCLRGILYIYGNRPAGYEVPLLFLVFAIWNVLFSPLIGITRLTLVAALYYGLHFRKLITSQQALMRAKGA